MKNIVFATLRYRFSSKLPQRPTVDQLKTTNSSNSSISRMIDMRITMDKRIKLDQEKNKDLQELFISHSDIGILLNLYMEHDCYKCQMADAVLNYHKVSYQRVQNILILDEIKRSKYIPLENYEWPVLKVNVNLDEPLLFTGVDEIVNYVVTSGLAFEGKPYSKYEAWNMQGVEFVKQIKENLDLLFLNPFLTWENIFKAPVEVFKKDGKGSRTPEFMIKILGRCASRSFTNFFQLIKRKEEYKKARQNFIDGIREFGGRLQGKDFHGGESPDEADFMLYGVLKSRYNSKTFQRFIEKNFSQNMYGWFVRMQVRCRYEEERFYAA